MKTCFRLFSFDIATTQDAILANDQVNKFVQELPPNSMPSIQISTTHNSNADITHLFIAVVWVERPKVL